jgi:hypothetical protein
MMIYVNVREVDYLERFPAAWRRPTCPRFRRREGNGPVLEFRILAKTQQANTEQLGSFRADNHISQPLGYDGAFGLKGALANVIILDLKNVSSKISRIRETTSLHQSPYRLS